MAMTFTSDSLRQLFQSAFHLTEWREYLQHFFGRINSAVLWRSSSVWQFARISSLLSVEIMKASLYPVLMP